jgi:hypothetical protein
VLAVFACRSAGIIRVRSKAARATPLGVDNSEPSPMPQRILLHIKSYDLKWADPRCLVIDELYGIEGGHSAPDIGTVCINLRSRIVKQQKCLKGVQLKGGHVRGPHFG